MSDNERIVFNFETNAQYFKAIDDILGLDENTTNSLEHIKNALELYMSVLQGMEEGKIPALVAPQHRTAEKLSLPPLLAQFKHEKELEHDRHIDLKRQL